MRSINVRFTCGVLMGACAAGGLMYRLVPANHPILRLLSNACGAGAGNVADLLDGTGGSHSSNSAQQMQRLQRYFAQQALTQTLHDADALYDAGQYLEVYELLSARGNSVRWQQQQHSAPSSLTAVLTPAQQQQLLQREQHPVSSGQTGAQAPIMTGPVAWRLGRALHHLAEDARVSVPVKRAMVAEAQRVLVDVVLHNDAMRDKEDLESQDRSLVYTWLAIITNQKSGMEGTKQRARAMRTVKANLQMAVKHSPTDRVASYMLGKMCYDISDMTWFQRWLARLMYGDLPECSFEEAYEHLSRASGNDTDLYYVPTLYMLGKTCFRLRQYFRARYYMNAAASLPPRTQIEQQYAAKAKHTLQKIDNANKKTIFYELGYTKQK